MCYHIQARLVIFSMHIHDCVPLEGQRIINAKPISPEILSLASTLVSGKVYAFARSYVLCPQADTGPDFCVDNQYA